MTDQETVNKAFRHMIESVKNNPMGEIGKIFYVMPDGQIKEFTAEGLKKYIDKIKGGRMEIKNVIEQIIHKHDGYSGALTDFFDRPEKEVNCDLKKMSKIIKKCGEDCPFFFTFSFNYQWSQQFCIFNKRIDTIAFEGEYPKNCALFCKYYF